MALQALDRDDDGLVHLVRDDAPDELLAARADWRGGHDLPPRGVAVAVSLAVGLAAALLPVRRVRRAGGGGAASMGSRLRSVITVKMRAIERRVWASWVWSVSWRVASWKRRS